MIGRTLNQIGTVIRCWNLETFTELYSLKTPMTPRVFDLDAEARRMVYGLGDGSVEVWHLSESDEHYRQVIYLPNRLRWT